MTRFDRILIVDWSGAGQPVKGANALWACSVRCDRDAFEVEWTENFATRHAFMERLNDVVETSLARGERLLAGFDCAFGYPAGAAHAIAGEGHWRALWRKIAADVEDDKNNGNNRFELASRWNADYFPGAPRFWGRPQQHRYDNLSDRKPPAAASAPFEKRISEKRAKGAKSVWQLNGAGTVGGQTLLGIARLSRFLDERGFADRIAVWPFETGFVDHFEKPVVFAEIYPSLFDLPDSEEVKDAVQVRTVAEAFARFQSIGLLGELFKRPEGMSDEEHETAIREEGWILGIGHRELGERRSLPEAASGPISVEPLDYIRDPAEIYRQSFATIRAEAALDRFPTVMQPLAIRLIHACGMTDLVDDLRFSEGAFEAGAAALAGGAPVLCDAEMVRHGIISRLLPAENDVICLLSDEMLRAKATEISNTRSAAEVDLWEERGMLDGAVVAIGNAPTALFRLLERLDAGAPKPAIILGFPVGFVGAAESKAELIANSRGVPYIAVRGRRGGSAMASAAVNALAGGLGTNV